MSVEASCSYHLPLMMKAAGDLDIFENYDVFISHRGPDTKTGFVGFLYDNLQKHGLQPYLDCKSIRMGEECWKSIENAIKRSPIAVVVFSERYVQSEWCLKELHVMLEAQSCKKVLPIFYNVTPWDVRNLERAQLKDEFKKLKDKFKSNPKVIEQWRADLEVASKLMGWEHSNKLTRSLEVDLVAKVVERILELANKSLPLDVGEYVVGVKEVAEKLIQSYLFEKEVCALGLWGMGGIGKSTLAKELYNHLCKRFEASCYVEDVTEKIMQGYGVVGVHKRILKDLCSRGVDNDNKSELKPILEDSLSKKRILLVLDDVSNAEMLNDMMTRKMLRKGSVCIVTSRDRHVFEASNIFEPFEREVYVHELNLLNLEDSKRVFISFAFGWDCEVSPNLKTLVTKISKLCCGVPLVLKVCGALLKGEGNLDVWEDVKTKLDLGAILENRNIFNCLRISYDSLEEKEKKVFLDIACALLGRSEDMAMCIWRSQGWEPHLGVRNLKKKALISVDAYGEFKMHDHLRDMGREIERVESEHNTRRLWMPMSLSLLEDKEPLPHYLQTLVITHAESNANLDLCSMKHLRILICDEDIILVSIPQNLRCLTWANYFGRNRVVNFPKVPKKNQLVLLHYVCYTHTCDFWTSFERLTRLESLKLHFDNKKEVLDFFENRQNHVLNFDKMYCLRDISLHGNIGKTISGFSSKHCNLRCLELTLCGSLQSCPSVGDLVTLEELSFNECWNLEELPNLEQLMRLWKLNIRFCGFIEEVLGLGNLVALVEFRASHCYRLATLHDIHKLTNLQILELGLCRSLKGIPGLCGLIALYTLEVDHDAVQGCLRLHKLHKLVTLVVNDWNGPPAFGDMVSLEHLRIWRSGEDIATMPNLVNLARLQSVELWGCKFKDVSCLGNLISLRSISIRYCDRLETLTDVRKLTRLENLTMEMCRNNVVWGGVGTSRCVETPPWLDQPGVDTSCMALHSLKLQGVGCRELPDLSLFPELETLSILGCPNLERLVSTTPMTALERLELYGCTKLQELPDLSRCKLLSRCYISFCKKISLTSREEIRKLEAMCPGLEIDFGSYWLPTLAGGEPT